MNCKAVIFDIDGTLLDTLKDITDSVNAEHIISNPLDLLKCVSRDIL